MKQLKSQEELNNMNLTANELLVFLQNLKMAGEDLDYLTVYRFDSEMLIPAEMAECDGETVNIY